MPRSTVETCLVEAFLGAEVAVDQRLGDAGSGGHGGDRRRREPVGAEVLRRDVEDLGLPIEAGDALGAGVGTGHARSLVM
jgi:hypothetical protein